jgi:hypothetical protein
MFSYPGIGTRDLSTTFRNLALIIGLDLTLYHLGLELALVLGLGHLTIEIYLFCINKFF